MKGINKLPDKWLLKIDDENKDIINDWRLNVCKNKQVPLYTEYVDQSGWIWGEVHVSRDNAPLISTDLFKEWVLKLHEFKLVDNKEDLIFLTKFLKQNNIT